MSNTVEYAHLQDFYEDLSPEELALDGDEGTSDTPTQPVDGGDAKTGEQEGSGTKFPSGEGEGKDDTAASSGDGKTPEGQGQKEEEQETPATEVTPGVSIKDQEAALLRKQLQENNQTISTLQAQLAKLQKSLKDQGLVEDEVETEASRVSAQLQQAQTQLLNTKLETLAEAMRLSPQYHDLDSVVTQERFDTFINAIANIHAKNVGKPANEARQEVESRIWGLSNPYKYLYDQIKQVHPDFEQDGKPGNPATTPAPSTSKPTAPAKEPPVSIAELGGSGSAASGWTADKIDNMDEDQLHKVPKEVYQKYLAGELA